MGLGCHISAHLAACFWTSCILLFLFINFSGADQGLFQDLGLKVLPDISKINISIDEYTRTMNTYLQMRENSVDDATPIPKLVTFKLDRKVVWKSKVSSVRLRFPVAQNNEADVESAQLRILAPPQYKDISSVKVQVNLVLGSKRKRLIEERTFYLSENASKWCEVDVTSAVQSWLNGDFNLGIELVCLNFNCNLDPLEAGLTTLIHTAEGVRVRRASLYHKERRTDCQKGRKKRRCCRQNMKVTFSKLEFPEMNFIVEPKVYEAGYCHGLCPPNYNHATNHSRIQSLMHQMERRNASRSSKKIIPKACCAPSKLGSLEIVLVDKDDHSKLMVEKWDNMKVIECACS